MCLVGDLPSLSAFFTTFAHLRHGLMPAAPFTLKPLDKAASSPRWMPTLANSSVGPESRGNTTPVVKLDSPITIAESKQRRAHDKPPATLSTTLDRKTAT